MRRFVPVVHQFLEIAKLLISEDTLNRATTAWMGLSRNRNQLRKSSKYHYGDKNTINSAEYLWSYNVLQQTPFWIHSNTNKRGELFLKECGIDTDQEFVEHWKIFIIWEIPVLIGWVDVKLGLKKSSSLQCLILSASRT